MYLNAKSLSLYIYLLCLFNYPFTLSNNWFHVHAQTLSLHIHTFVKITCRILGSILIMGLKQKTHYPHFYFAVWNNFKRGK